MYGYEEWQFTSQKSKELFNKILKEFEVLSYRSSIYADLMVTTENAYNDKQITQQEYERLNNFISSCCKENSLKNEQEFDDHKKAVSKVYKVYKEKNFLWKLFHKKMKPTVAINRLSVEELDEMAQEIKGKTK